MENSKPNYNRRLYVGNLHPNMTRDDLDELFGFIGTVDNIFLPTEKGDRRQHKGFAFVEMADPAFATLAVRILHETDYYYDRVMVVQLAEPRKDNGKKGNY